MFLPEVTFSALSRAESDYIIAMKILDWGDYFFSIS